MTKRILILAFFFISPLMAFAHGEEQPGPNGGYVRMPGPFHTELEIDNVQGAHIFLLDSNLTNPMIRDSSVEAKFESKNKSIPYKCAIMGRDHFHCVPQGKLPAKGKLKIKAIRDKVVGNEVVYELPLKPFAKSESTPAPTDHSSHH